MTMVAKILAANAVTLVSVVAAAYLLASGVAGWWWFLVVAVLFGHGYQVTK